ncbi:hypothetical protein JCGZ_04084 [Jatropha curcas]|uniref:Uncharacterized protein n=1 Tax=Jatropha curcas TaxID=180498 RepID=A0A067KRC3_JATCU|nr:hypothetical protein JCGZ_04084 [Jatropha curcas]
MNEEIYNETHLMLQPASPSIEFPNVQTLKGLHRRRRREMTSRCIPIEAPPVDDIPQVPPLMTYNYYEVYRTNMSKTSSSAPQPEWSIPSVALEMPLNIYYTSMMAIQ